MFSLSPFASATKHHPKNYASMPKDTFLLNITYAYLCCSSMNVGSWGARINDEPLCS